MGFLKRIRRHASIATGNFASMFREVEIPPLPAAATRLIAEVNQPEPDIKNLVKVISAAPELSAKVIQTVNSAFFSLPNRVTTVLQAITLLGLRHIRAIALSYTMIAAVPRPRNTLFDHEAFWTDSLFRALLARAFTRKTGLGDPEEAFTAMLLADIALPVLLGSWREYYTPVIQEWHESHERLSTIERRHFRWDHAQAGAWILQSWGFLENTVCLVAVHNLTAEGIEGFNLSDTIAMPLVIASLAPSVLRPDPHRAGRLLESAMDTLSITPDGIDEILRSVSKELAETLSIFGIHRTEGIEDLKALLDPNDAGEAEAPP